MQYVRSISGSVSKTWNSLNPATLSGAIDVIVVEQEDGALACSPFHIRFGKFSLLRPSEKKVEFSVNGDKQDFPMKLGDGGEAFFVFETQDTVPEALQTSPLVSPATSPQLGVGGQSPVPSLQEPDHFELEGRSETSSQELSPNRERRGTLDGIPRLSTAGQRTRSDNGAFTLLSQSAIDPPRRSLSGDFSAFVQPKLERAPSDSVVPQAKDAIDNALMSSEPVNTSHSDRAPLSLQLETERPSSPTAQESEDAKLRAMNLSKKLWTSNISNQVTESGDLMLDMTGYKSGNMEALQAEGIARQLLSEELEGPYDIGSLIGADDKGNIWIYSSEEAKEAANKKAAANALGSYNPAGFASTDALSDPGYHSDDARSDGKQDFAGAHNRRDSDSAVGLPSPSTSPAATTSAGDPNKNYAKTLRLTSDQLKTMGLKNGANEMAFTVNRATCKATLWYWKHNVPIVISDIDGTITKSDVLGHLLTQIGRDWTHPGVAKLYTEIAANGYNFLYLTSRSVGLADTTKAYLDGVVQDGYRLPKGAVILSPDRTMAALRREVYLRKPEIFKMACCRDIMTLFIGHGGAENTTEGAIEAGLKPSVDNLPKSKSPFYAGFGNRFTDAISYRSVGIPSTRIFTINSNSEISLDLLTLNKYKTGYSTMREIVDHYFPPVGQLAINDSYTDFTYWRDRPLDIVDFTDSETEGDDEDDDDDEEENDKDAAGRVTKTLKKLTLTNTRASTILSDDDDLEESDEGDDEEEEDELDDEMISSYVSAAQERVARRHGNLTAEDSDEDASLTDDGETFEVDVPGVTSPPRLRSPELNGKSPSREVARRLLKNLDSKAGDVKEKRRRRQRGAAAGNIGDDEGDSVD
jgi:phosphatidate phosphatase LPIN